MSDCRQGMRVRADGLVRKNVKVEVGVEIGLMVNVETEPVGDEINKEDVEVQVREKVEDIFQIDGRDKVLTNVCIYNIQ